MSPVRELKVTLCLKGPVVSRVLHTNNKGNLNGH